MPAKKVAYATEDDFNQGMNRVAADISKAQEAAEKATQQCRADLLSELRKLSEVVTENANTTKAAVARVAEDAVNFTSTSTLDLRKELTRTIEELDKKLMSHEKGVERQMEQLNSDVQAMMSTEIVAFSEQVDKELSSAKAEVLEQAQKWAQEAAEHLVAEQRARTEGMDKLHEDLAKLSSELKAYVDEENQRLLSEQTKTDQAQNDRNERAQTELWLKLGRHDELIKETKEGAKEHADDVDSRAIEGISTLRSDAEGRLDGLDDLCSKLHDGVLEVENLPTRRVDWVIRNVSKRVRPPSASKACLHTSLFSPKFNMAGAHGLQLELQLYRASDPPVEGEHAGDCAAFLWACRGMNLVYKLYVGTRCAQLEKLFNGRVPYGTKRLCFLRDQINRDEDTVRVSLEILEAVREIEHQIKPPPASIEDRGEADDESAKPLEGKLVFRRHVNNRLTDQVKNQVETMRSRMVRHVEWRVEQASMLRRCFPPGEPMCSVPFAAAGVEGLQLMFYPCGYNGATDGFCSLFLYASAGSTLKFTLFAGTHRRDATNFFEEAGAFGRTNFCRFDSIVDEQSDTIQLALEIEEAHQDVTTRTAHPIVAPGDRRSQGQIDAAVPKAVESVVKMQRVPGKLGGGLEEKRVLPSLWTAKSLGERAGPNDMRSFDDLQPSARPTVSSHGRPKEMPSPTGSTPLSASRSLPQLSKENSSVELPQFSKTSGDWAGKKARGGLRATRKGMAKTVPPLEADTTF